MKLSGKGLAAFLRRPTPDVVAVLLFGPDRGLMRERADALARTVAGTIDDPFRLAELASERLRDEPGLLADEARALAFGGGRRLVRLRNAGEACCEAARRLLAQDAVPGLVLLEAGDLPAKSALRQLCEKAANAAVIACYPDNADAVRSLIVETLTSQRLRIGEDALDYLAVMLGADRAITRSELDKLCLYMSGDDDTISVEDIAAVVGDASAVTLGSLAFAAGDGDQQALDRALTTAYAEGMDLVAVLRTVAGHIQRLRQARSLIAAGRTMAQATAALKPRLIFHQEPRFRRQLETWSEPRLATALRLLTEAELACKTTGAPATLLCNRALMRIAQAAAGARRSRRSSGDQESRA